MTMKAHHILTSILFSAFLVTACAPSATDSMEQPSSTVSMDPSATPLAGVPSPTLEVVARPSAEWTVTVPVDAPPVATSRGPDLHATDPTTINLATGKLHFVEFFRFT